MRFSPHKPTPTPSSASGFGYLDTNKYFYFDSACQTIRPQEVIDAENQYYHEFNACGHRVKYKWGELVDKKVEETRQALLKLVGKSTKDYTVAFTLNTTLGINFVLHQIRPEKYQQIITSEIEHNSVFLPTITWAKRNKRIRKVLPRLAGGGLDYAKEDLAQAVVLVNTTNNIDGRHLENVRQLAQDVRATGGVLLLDAAQTLGHNSNFLKDVDFDAAFGSGHKMYGPSLGFIIIKKSLLRELDCYLLGGSTVSDVQRDTFQLIDNDDEIYARLEPGLQNFAGIIGLGEATRWKETYRPDGKSAEEHEEALRIHLNAKLKEVPEIHMLYSEPSSVVSIYSDKIDGHKLGIYLSERNIMCRTGYHCCHYYLKELKKLPPLFRISLGLHNSVEQIDFLVDSLKALLR